MEAARAVKVSSVTIGELKLSLRPFLWLTSCEGNLRRNCGMSAVDAVADPATPGGSVDEPEG